MAGGIDEFRIRRVGHIDEAALEVLAIEASGKRLIPPLEPVRSDDARTGRALPQVFKVATGAFLLVARRDETCVQHSPIQRPEMELADEHRSVLRSFRKVVVGRTRVNVQRYNIAEARGDAVDLRVAPADAVAEMEVVRQLLAKDALHGRIVCFRGVLRRSVP